MIHRRDLLLGMGASLLVGCPRPTAQVAAAKAAGEKVRLGWRWIPGTSFTYDSVVTRVVGEVSFARGESWTYTAQDLDASGVMSLRGDLVGFGATVTQNGEAISETRLRAAREAARDAATPQVDVRLRLNGRLVSCSLDDFDNGLPHRLLAMQLPTDPVVMGAAWDDPGLPLAFAQLLPVEMPVSVVSRTTFSRFTAVDRSWQARLEHKATVHTTDGGPVLEITGYSLWDAEPGALASRRLEVRLVPDETIDGVPLGVLRAEINRDRKANGPIAAL